MILLETITEPVPATGMYLYLWLMIAVPAVSAAVLLLAGRLADAWGHLLGTLAPSSRSAWRWPPSRACC